MTSIDLQLRNLEAIDFIGKGEAFVESRFLTPLLECLGYETHGDYEVIRHSDDGSSFKLNYPPVEAGAKRVKHYAPDYLPTIRKKMFWVIEAKSPKDVSYPFGAKYLVQGLQYCIHPEIQAQYLLVSNGAVSCLFDAHGAVFLGKEMYEPVLTFKSFELQARWPEIYSFLGVEKLRTRIEEQLKVSYDKLCLTSLDKTYPAELLARTGASAREHSELIAKRTNKMYVESMNKEKDAWQETMETLGAEEIYALMDDPMPTGTNHAHFFLRKAVAEGMGYDHILRKMTHDFERQSIFRKEHTFLIVCYLYLRTDAEGIKQEAKAFLDRYKDVDLPLLNQTECALLRFTRKSNVLHQYPVLRELLQRQMRSAPELVRFVEQPSAFTVTYASEVASHHRVFGRLQLLADTELQKLLDVLLALEAGMEEAFQSARKNLTNAEKQLMGFEIYGAGARHYFFRGVLHNYGIERRPDLPELPPTVES